MTQVDSQTCNTLGVPLVLSVFSNEARSNPGSYWIKALTPAPDPGQRDIRALHVAEAQTLRAKGLEPGFANLFDISALADHIKAE